VDNQGITYWDYLIAPWGNIWASKPYGTGFSTFLSRKGYLAVEMSCGRDIFLMDGCITPLSVSVSTSDCDSYKISLPPEIVSLCAKNGEEIPDRWEVSLRDFESKIGVLMDVIPMEDWSWMGEKEPWQLSNENFLYIEKYYKLAVYCDLGVLYPPLSAENKG